MICMPKFLGIDTSCYTTSLAVVDSAGRLLAEHRQLLHVPAGTTGLQQSSAVFQHVQNLPVLFAKITQSVDLRDLQAITASSRPRPVKKSYMPVFTVGHGFGKSLAAALQVPFLATSHQEGHLMAGLWSTGWHIPPKFLAVHLSGGTSEVLLIELAQDTNSFFRETLLGGTTDLHAGQLVDRIGVALGLPFPAGPHLEKLAGQAKGLLSIPSAVNGYNFSFSGPETRARQYIQAGEDPAEIARAVERCIAKTVEKTLRLAIAEYGCREILIVGGVAANTFLKVKLTEKLGHPSLGAELYFAANRYSSDNAVGVALMGAYLE